MIDDRILTNGTLRGFSRNAGSATIACGLTLAAARRILYRMHLPADEALCPDCGYSLAGLPLPERCPECGSFNVGSHLIVLWGKRLDGPLDPAAWDDSTGRHSVGGLSMAVAIFACGIYFLTRRSDAMAGVWIVIALCLGSYLLYRSRASRLCQMRITADGFAVRSGPGAVSLEPWWGGETISANSLPPGRIFVQLRRSEFVGSRGVLLNGTPDEAASIVRQVTQWIIAARSHH